MFLSYISIIELYKYVCAFFFYHIDFSFYSVAASFLFNSPISGYYAESNSFLCSETKLVD